MQDETDLDLLLNEALRTYSAVDPSAAWQPNLLHAVRTPKRSWRMWIAVPALTGVMLAIFAIQTPSPRPISIAAPPIVHIADPRLPAPARRKPVPRRRARLPKEQIFPKPAPLTPEERSLLFLAAYYPAEMNDLTQALEIRPMQIPALQIDTENKDN